MMTITPVESELSISPIGRMPIPMPGDMAAEIGAVVAAGDSAAASEVVRDALRAWTPGVRPRWWFANLGATATLRECQTILHTGAASGEYEF